MAVQAIGGTTAAASIVPTATAKPGDATRARAPQEKDSTIVVSTVTKTNPDGSTVTTITYADGHTKVETTPPKYAATEATGIEEGGRVTAVDLLA